ncbi:MAG: alpha-hydroxy acid oxidase [Sphingomonadales bacterium]
MNAANVLDLRLNAKKALPKPVFDFIDGAGFEEKTLNANTSDFEKWRFRQYVMRDISKRNLETTIVGEKSSMPAAISPTGMSGILRGTRAEIYAARAAKKAGIPFTLGMMSIASLEEVVEAAGAVWFQLCLLKDRGLVQMLVDRALAADAPVLILTVTWPTMGQTNRFIRNRTTSLPPNLTLSTAWEFASKPGWSLRALFGKKITLGNFDGHMQGPSDLPAILGQLEDAPSWKDIEWLRSIWPRKLIVKGVMEPEDAIKAFDAGADAISISNHGGNCLDEGRSTISALPDIVDAVGERGEILIDGGIRSGQDVLKAVALGARACLLGRAHLFGLAADGENGVTAALEFIRHELSITMAYVGVTDVHAVGPSILVEEQPAGRRNR